MLFLEEVIESVSGVGRVGRRSDLPISSASAGIPSFPLDGCSDREEFAAIPEILFSNPHGNRLRTFKLRPGIEMPAVLTGVQVGFTFRALRFRSDCHGRDRSAQGTAEDFLKAGHLHRPRCFPGFGPPGSSLRFFARSFFSFGVFAAAGILISPLAVFSIHSFWLRPIGLALRDSI